MTIEGINQAQLGYIEYLNDLGFIVVAIDNTFYVVSEFIPADETVSHKHTLIGRNVTAKILNAISVANRTQQLEGEVRNTIDGLLPRRREFSSNLSWKIYDLKG